MSPAENPYAPPRAELATRGAAPAPLAFALAVFANHRLVFLLAAIWLPLNVGVEWRTQGDDVESLVANFRLASLVGLFVQPLCIGVVFEACRHERAGLASTFSGLLGGAKWSRVFAANFVATLIIGLGVIAFVIPGLLLWVRYAFVEAAAACEGLSSAKARARSRQLVAGRAWRIGGVYTAFVAAGGVAALAYGVAVAFAPALGHFAAVAVFDTVFGLGHLLLFAVLWAMYDEAVAERPVATQTAPPAAAAQPLTAGVPS